MRRLVKWTTNTMLGLLVLAALFLVVLPAVFASSLAVVLSGSMEPLMPVGSLAVMKSVEPTQIEVGDIIAFKPRWDPDVTVSHRVIEVIEEPFLAFRTKGDANEDPDWDILPVDYVLARVAFNIPKLGYVLNRISGYIRGPLALALCVILPTVLLIGSAMRDVNSALNPKKRRIRQRQKMLKRRRKRRSRLIAGLI